MKREFLLTLYSKIFLSTLLLIFIQSTLFAQTPTEVTGTVYDETGAPLYGVVVQLKDGSAGTSTDENGKYTIAVKDMFNGILQFQFTGYETKEIPVKGQKVIDTKMGEDVKMLEEIVKVGYGSKTKPKVTESISSVDEKEMRQTVNPSLENALQGRATGVQVLQNSGQPGSPSSVRIRGIGSINGGEPLYVIDGVMVDQQALNLLNPSDIERMDVLKDASSAAIYGSRGANGVVIITTKRGKEGKPRINFDASYGVQQVWKRLDLMETPEYLAHQRRAYQNSGVAIPSAFAEGSNSRYQQTNTNWQDAIFRRPSEAPVQNYNIGMSGGNEFANYNVSAGYFDQVGTLVGTDFKRYSLRVNSDINAKKWLRFGESISLSRADQVRKEIGATVLDIRDAITTPPMLPIGENPDLAQTKVGGFNWVNPILNINSVKNQYYSYRAFGNVYAELEPLKGLKYRLNLGLDAVSSRGKYIREVFNPEGGSANSLPNPTRTISDNREETFSPLIEHTVSYSKVIKKHDFSALVGFSQQTWHRTAMNGTNLDIPQSISPVNYAGGGRITGGDDDEWRLRGYLGRINYSFADKYLLTVNARYDGSSKFGKVNRYGFFPSVSAGWRLMEENFMKNIPIMKAIFNDIKIRAGAGVIGAQEPLTTGRIYPNMNDKVAYIWGGRRVRGLAPEGLTNEFLKWESVYTKNIGLDVSILDNRLSLILDYFTRRSEGMLLEQRLPATSGFTRESEIPGDRLWVNAGNMVNKGYEIGLTYRETEKKLRYSVGVNFSQVKNEILQLGNTNSPLIGTESRTQTQVGGTVGAFYGHVTDGIFQNQAEINAHPTQGPNTKPGDIRFKDINNDGKITEDDRTIIGNSIPKFTYGVTSTFEYGIFDVRLFFQGVYGNKVYNLLRQRLESGEAPNSNLLSTVNNSWTPENGSTTMPRATLNDQNRNGRLSDRWIESGSYLRLKSIQIGATLPKSWVKKLTRAEELTFRVYGSINNAITITKYSGYDPEIGSALLPPPQNSPDPLNTGVDLGNYPQSRTYTVGLQLNF